MSEKLLSFSAVAREAGITRPTLYKWQASGRFNVKPHDDKFPPRWRASDIIAWLAAPHPEDDQPRLDGI